MKSLCLENIIPKKRAGYWHFPRKLEIRDPLRVWGHAKGCRKEALTRFALGFDLAVLSSVFCFWVGFFFDYAAWHWHSFLCFRPAFLEELSAPTPPEGNRASAAQHHLSSRQTAYGRFIQTIWNSHNLYRNKLSAVRG